MCSIQKRTGIWTGKQLFCYTNGIFNTRGYKKWLFLTGIHLVYGIMVYVLRPFFAVLFLFFSQKCHLKIKSLLGNNFYWVKWNTPEKSFNRQNLEQTRTQWSANLLKFICILLAIFIFILDLYFMNWLSCFVKSSMKS